MAPKVFSESQGIFFPLFITETILLYNRIYLVPDEGSESVCEVTRSDEGMCVGSKHSEGAQGKYPRQYKVASDWGDQAETKWAVGPAGSTNHGKSHLTT